MNKIVIPAHSNHINWIARNMRLADMRECCAGGFWPAGALRRSLRDSVAAWTGMVDDRPICMFGVTPLDILGGVGAPWLLGTDEVQKHWMTFLRLNMGYLRRMLLVFPTLVNYVDVRNALSIEWLKWLGFKFDPQPVPYGVWDLPFYRFEMKSRLEAAPTEERIRCAHP